MIDRRRGRGPVGNTERIEALFSAAIGKAVASNDDSWFPAERGIDPNDRPLEFRFAEDRAGDSLTVTVCYAVGDPHPTMASSQIVRETAWGIHLASVLADASGYEATGNGSVRREICATSFCRTFRRRKTESRAKDRPFPLLSLTPLTDHMAVRAVVRSPLRSEQRHIVERAVRALIATQRGEPRDELKLSTKRERAKISNEDAILYSVFRSES